MTSRGSRHRRLPILAAMSLLAAGLISIGASPAHADPDPSVNARGWGFNNYGYIGNGSTTDHIAPPFPYPGNPLGEPEKYVTQISAGPGVLALHSDGTVTAWGRNDEGQLGIAGLTSYRELVPRLTSLPPVIQVSAGGNDFGLGLLGGGTVYSFGRNIEGQLGRTISGNVDPTPRQVAGLPATITSVSAGGSHSLALTSDGHVWAWGWNQFGQLGDPSKYSTTYGAFQVPNMQNITSVSASGNDSYALDSSGHVWKWGSNYTGQGVAPIQVSGLSDIKSIAGGFNHALALDNDGYVWAWGSNQYGQVGDDGSTGWRSSPVKLTSISGIKSISATNQSSFAIKSDGTAWSWGVNWFGQLGDGTTTQRNTRFRSQVFPMSPESHPTASLLYPGAICRRQPRLQWATAS